MTKADSDAKKGRPKMELVKAPPPSFFKAAPVAEARAEPKPVEVDGKDLLQVARANGKGWDEGIAELLKVPPTLLKRVGESGTFYSRNGKFEIQDILSGMAMGKISGSLTDYGAALYSTGGSVYFVFADMERRIVVRERMFCIHNDPPETDWRLVKGKIEAAIALSESEPVKKSGAVAVYDQMLQPVVPS